MTPREVFEARDPQRYWRVAWARGTEVFIVHQSWDDAKAMSEKQKKVIGEDLNWFSEKFATDPHIQFAGRVRELASSLPGTYQVWLNDELVTRY